MDGELLNQDKFYWGTPKGVSKAYVQVVIDVFCSRAFLGPYMAKLPVPYADLLYDRVLPFYGALSVKSRRDPHLQRPTVLRHPGTSSLRTVVRHGYTEHRTTTFRSPLYRAHEPHTARE